MNFQALDVGCGADPRGDVNCDLFTGFSPHFEAGHKTTDPKTIPNFVKCDAEFLPFRNNAFGVVVARALLEHVKHPFNVLTEFKRVSNNAVIVEVPNLNKVVFWENQTHLFTWSEHSLRVLLEYFFAKVEIYSAYYRIRGRILRKIPFLGYLVCLMLQRIINPHIVGIGYKMEKAETWTIHRDALRESGKT